MPKRHVLSKSTYLRGLKCHKSLYLNKYHSELRDELDEATRIVFERGTNVGKLAQKLFPNGFDASPPTPFDYQKSVVLTQELVANGAEIIYEACFQYEGVLCALDILVNKNDGWHAFEVKSSNNVHDYYYDDVALQYFVIKNSGLRLKDISLIHFDREYIKQGPIDVKRLFKMDSMFKESKARESFVQEKIKEFKYVLANRKIPEPGIGPHCLAPFGCDFYGHCWAHVPEESVFTLTRLQEDIKFELYNQGIISIKDIPDDYKLSDAQIIQRDSSITGEVIIDKEKIGGFLQTLNWPLYFFDFETINPGVPLFDNSSPYQRIPFQYSLHYRKQAGAKVTHSEYLGVSDINIDPREPLIKQLLEETASPGDILVYNQSFEKSVLSELASDFPKYKKPIEERISRIKDLLVPFRKKYYYTPGMQGSASIKAVLPEVVPGFSYDELEIGEGGAASAIYESLYYNDNAKEVAKSRKDLLAYCKMDTEAMVRILEVLVEQVK